MAPTLGYWKIRGLVEPIRLLLAHVGQEYEMKTYSFGPAPDFDQKDWLDAKNNLGLDFPNLPYYIDESEDVKITQSIAILRYLAHKHDLIGKSSEETIKLDMVEQLAMDLIMRPIIIWYYINDDNSFEELKSKLITQTKAHITQLSKFLGNNQYIIGDRVTYVDFMLYSYLDYNRLFHPESFSDETTINEYLSRIESIPGVKKFITSENYSRFPITGPMARFGGSKPSD